MKKTWFGIISLSFMMLCCSPAFAEVNSVPSIIWTVQKGILYVDVQGVDFYNIDDFAWKGRVITDQVNNGIKYGTILLQEYTNGFRLTIKESDTSLEEPGEFSLMLKTGEEVNITCLQVQFSLKKCVLHSQRHYLPVLLRSLPVLLNAVILLIQQIHTHVAQTVVVLMEIALGMLGTERIKHIVAGENHCQNGGTRRTGQKMQPIPPLLEFLQNREVTKMVIP